MADKNADISGAGVLSLYVIEGSVIALVVTRALALNGPGLVSASAAVAAVVLGAWAAGWPVYARMTEYARDAAQRAAHPGSTFKGRMPPFGAAGVAWKLARYTVGALFAAQNALYTMVPIAFRPPMVLLWLAAGAAAVGLLPTRKGAALPVKSVVVDDAPVVQDAAVDPYACPAGTEKKGKPPPEGREVWCESGGKKNGPYRKWHDDASERLAVQGSFKDGARDGMWKSWYSSGREENEGAFKSGKPDGHHLAWDETGKKILDVTYDDGAEIRK